MNYDAKIGDSLPWNNDFLYLCRQTKFDKENEKIIRYFHGAYCADGYCSCGSCHRLV